MDITSCPVDGPVGQEVAQLQRTAPVRRRARHQDRHHDHGRRQSPLRRPQDGRRRARTSDRRRRARPARRRRSWSTAINASRDLMIAAQDALKSATIVKKGEVVGYVDDGLGGPDPGRRTKDVKAVGWAGLTVKLKLATAARRCRTRRRPGTVVGTLTVGEGAEPGQRAGRAPGGAHGAGLRRQADPRRLTSGSRTGARRVRAPVRCIRHGACSVPGIAQRPRHPGATRDAGTASPSTGTGTRGGRSDHRGADTRATSSAASGPGRREAARE